MDKQDKKEIAKVVVITGATGYVGEEIAKKLANDGMKIAIIYRTKSKDICEKLLKELSGRGHKSYECDLNNQNEVTEIISQIENDMGDIFACVHAAGTMPIQKYLHQLSTKEVEEQLESDVLTAFNFLQTCSLFLKKKKIGVIIGITTAGVATNINTKARGVYSVVKFAIQGILVALKEELQYYGVRVYSIAPGVMEGGLNKNTPKAFLEIVKEKTPNKKLANATDVAEMVSFLCEDESKHLTDLTILIAPESKVL